VKFTSFVSLSLLALCKVKAIGLQIMEHYPQPKLPKVVSLILFEEVSIDWSCYSNYYNPSNSSQVLVPRC
jgi:hypothetical protein